MTVHELMEDLRQGEFTSLGGYPLFFLTEDGGTLHPRCVREEIWTVARATRDGYEKSWCVVAHDVNWEDPSMICDHCNERIESAYAEDEAT